MGACYQGEPIIARGSRILRFIICRMCSCFTAKRLEIIAQAFRPGNGSQGNAT